MAFTIRHVSKNLKFNLSTVSQSIKCVSCVPIEYNYLSLNGCMTHKIHDYHNQYVSTRSLHSSTISYAKKPGGSRNKIPEPKIIANERIKANEVRVVEENGTQLGVMSKNDALKRAKMSGVDLVLVAPQANPPVCKLTSAARLHLGKVKAEKEARKVQREQRQKEMRYSSNIETHDLEVKTNKVKGFLRRGKNVRITVAYNPGIPHEYLEPLRRRVIRQVVTFVGRDGYADPSSLTVQGPMAMLDFKADVTKKEDKDQYAILKLLEKPLMAANKELPHNSDTQMNAAAVVAGQESEVRDDLLGAAAVAEINDETRAAESLAEYMAKKVVQSKKMRAQIRSNKQRSAGKARAMNPEQVERAQFRNLGQGR